jgi:hypothetical protein
MFNTKVVLSTLVMATAAPAMAAPNINSLSTVAPHQDFLPKLDVSINGSFEPYFNGSLTSIVAGSTDTAVQPNTVDVIDKIKALKVALGLPNTAVADIFGISRQALHGYFNTPNFAKNIRSKTLERSIKLEAVTQLINNRLDRSPGALSKNISVEGLSLFDLLKSDELEFDKIEAVVDYLAEKMSTSGKALPFNQQTLHDLTSST